MRKLSHVNRLRREINILRMLDHPNIVKLYDVLVMTLVKLAETWNNFVRAGDRRRHHSSYGIRQRR
jgi:serine/threonine protein kinase